MLQDVLTLKSPNVTIVFLKLNDLFVKNNNIVINKRYQSLYYCVHSSAVILFSIRELVMIGVITLLFQKTSHTLVL
jgi:hypothetical protein